MKPLLLFVSGLALLASFAKPHAYHVSVTELKHNPKDQSLEITCKIFTDDLEQALVRINETSIDLLSRKDSARAFGMIEAYFQKKLIITADDARKDCKFLGFEREEDYLWCYMEATGLPKLDRLCVENTLLFDFIPEQTNMMHFISSGGRKSIRLDNPSSKTCFE